MAQHESLSRALLMLAPVLLLAAAWPARACNPDAPRPPILAGYDYDRTAAEQLLRDSTTVVAARLARRLDLEVSGEGVKRVDYVFEALEGWRAERPRYIAIGGHWLSCILDLRPGRVFFLYLDGERLLHAVPVEKIDFELEMLGEPDWFYDARGQLVTPAAQ
jgi:hypothetical protein